MEQLNFHEWFEKLRRAGFTGLEISRLSRFRQVYVVNEKDQAEVDLAHLQFVRWLVEHGRLTDQLV